MAAPGPAADLACGVASGLRCDDPLQRKRHRARRCGRAVGGGRPQPKVSEDLFDDRGLLDKRDDPHGSRALGTHERIHLVHLLDQASASSAERRAHVRFASEGDISLDSTMALVASPCAFRRFPRPTLL